MNTHYHNINVIILEQEQKYTCVFYVVWSFLSWVENMGHKKDEMMKDKREIDETTVQTIFLKMIYIFCPAYIHFRAGAIMMITARKGKKKKMYQKMYYCGIVVEHVLSSVNVCDPEKMEAAKEEKKLYIIDVVSSFPYLFSLYQQPQKSK